MSTPLIQYLRLDQNNDPDFTSSSELTNADAVAQAILTRLNLFLGEWWENLNLGLPVFQSMLGQLASLRGQAAAQLAVTQIVLGTPFVTAVTSVDTAFVAGQLSITVKAQTSFGLVTVNNVPGLSASIGALS